MIDTKGVAKALLQYRHTPVLGIWNSPAQMLLGRTPKDALPTSPQKRTVQGSVQNMECNHSLQLNKTYKVAERLENRQYLVKYDQELWAARCTYGGAGGALKNVS